MSIILQLQETWSRDNHPEIVSGVRTIYRTNIYSMCPVCFEFSNTIHDFLGKKYYVCKNATKLSVFHNPYWTTNLLERIP